MVLRVQDGSFHKSFNYIENNTAKSVACCASLNLVPPEPYMDLVNRIVFLEVIGLLR